MCYEYAVKGMILGMLLGLLITMLTSCVAFQVINPQDFNSPPIGTYEKERGIKGVPIDEAQSAPLEDIVKI